MFGTSQHRGSALQCRRSHASAQHVEDKALWETQLVALQDTRNLTVAELERLRVELVLKQRAAAFQEQTKSGQAKIKQLQVRSLFNSTLVTLVAGPVAENCHEAISFGRLVS
jgi:hypothetical protein